MTLYLSWDCMLVLVDLKSKDLTGDVAEKGLESVGIIVNRNVIPGDPQRPDITSGIRVGSPGITTRGMGLDEIAPICFFNSFLDGFNYNKQL